MRFKKDLRNHIPTKQPDYIVEVTIDTIDFIKLSKEIDEFNNEIKWDDMWDIEEVKNRLSNGWRFVVYMPNDEIKGWIWLDNTNEPKNIYVNKNHRNKGIAKELYFEIHNICKKNNLEEIIGYIDDWNLISIKSIKKAGWVECI